MEKVSHKFIKENSDITLNCNIYTGENIVAYIQAKDIERIKKELNNESNQEQLKQIENIIEGAKNRTNCFISLEKIAYSCGVNGNNGQLYKVYYYIDNEGKFLLSTLGF